VVRQDRKILRRTLLGPDIGEQIEYHSGKAEISDTDERRRALPESVTANSHFLRSVEVEKENIMEEGNPDSKDLLSQTTIRVLQMSQVMSMSESCR